MLKRILEQIWEAVKGKCLWSLVKIKGRVDQDTVVIFLLEEDDELNYYALLHLPDYVKRKLCDKAVIVSRPELFYDIGCNIDLAITHLTMKEKKIEYILKYYCLVKFYDKVVFVSLNRPESNHGNMIVGKHGVTKEDIICLGLYCLRKVPKGENTVCMRKNTKEYAEK